jgi:hypothetical protein
VFVDNPTQRKQHQSARRRGGGAFLYMRLFVYVQLPAKKQKTEERKEGKRKQGTSFFALKM